MTTKPFKFKIIDGEGVLDVRRVKLPDNVSLEVVMKRVESWCGAGKCLKYVDQENDEVTVEEQDEWEECLNLCGGEPFVSLKVTNKRTPCRGKKIQNPMPPLPLPAPQPAEQKCQNCTYVSAAGHSFCCRRCAKGKTRHSRACQKAVCWPAAPMSMSPPSSIQLESITTLNTVNTDTAPQHSATSAEETIETGSHEAVRETPPPSPPASPYSVQNKTLIEMGFEPDHAKPLLLIHNGDLQKVLGDLICN
eukprot:TRINITY_DN1645_c0_g1_i1.p1 TRINITY_DN1645_c0_g1~~TRINITY_DN1645_c0_g1_i1.p1  ORF type:complete len:249 (+),score=31.46 TRINITY_DN1645_c0_g1_i1:56-802(+)